MIPMAFAIQILRSLARHAKAHHNHAELDHKSKFRTKSWRVSMTRDLQADDKLTVNE